MLANKRGKAAVSAAGIPPAVGKSTIMEIRQMPDITVDVTFTDPDTFSFNPSAASLNAAGKVILKRKPANAAWTFVSVNNLPSSQFTWKLEGNAPKFTSMTNVRPTEILDIL